MSGERLKVTCLRPNIDSKSVVKIRRIKVRKAGCVICLDCTHSWKMNKRKPKHRNYDPIVIVDRMKRTGGVLGRWVLRC